MNPISSSSVAPPPVPTTDTAPPPAPSDLTTIKHLSPSSIKLWYDCPRSWWARYIEKRKTPAGAAADLGSSFGVEIVKALACPVNLDAPNAREKFNPNVPALEPSPEVASLMRTYQRKPWAWKSADMAEAEAKMSVQQIGKLAEHFGLAAPRHIFAPFLGYIDLMRYRMPGGPPEIVDLKTSKMKGFKASWAFQLLTYCCAVESVSASIHLTTTTKIPAAYCYALRVDPTMLKWAMSRLVRAYREIETALSIGETPDEEPGYHCAYCAVVECPVKYALDCAGVAIE